MKARLMAGVAATVLGFSSPLLAQEFLRIPISVGLPYDKARSALVSAGWQPHIPGGPHGMACGFAEHQCETVDAASDSVKDIVLARERKLRQWFFDRKMYEAVHCYLNRPGTCVHLFKDAYGRRLAVQTTYGDYGEYGGPVTPAVVVFQVEPKWLD